MGSFLKFLGMVKIIATYNHQLSEFFQQLVRQLGLEVGVGFFLIEHLRVVATVQLKRRVTCAVVHGVVIGKHSH